MSMHVERVLGARGVTAACTGAGRYRISPREFPLLRSSDCRESCHFSPDLGSLNVIHRPVVCGVTADPQWRKRINDEVPH